MNPPALSVGAANAWVGAETGLRVVSVRPRAANRLSLRLCEYDVLAVPRVGPGAYNALLQIDFEMGGSVLTTVDSLRM